MKQKKLKFTIVGLIIFSLLAVGFMFVLKIQDTVIWTALMTHISILIGVYAHYNHKDKKAHLENKNNQNIQ